MNIMDMIKPELLVLVVALYFLGSALKKSQLNDKYIPIILGIAGVITAAMWVCATTSLVTMQDVLLAIFVGITQGVICAGMSVYVNQLIKQGQKE